MPKRAPINRTLEIVESNNLLQNNVFADVDPLVTAVVPPNAYSVESDSVTLLQSFNTIAPVVATFDAYITAVILLRIEGENALDSDIGDCDKAPDKPIAVLSNSTEYGLLNNT